MVTVTVTGYNLSSTPMVLPSCVADDPYFHRFWRIRCRTCERPVSEGCRLCDHCMAILHRDITRFIRRHVRQACCTLEATTTTHTA